MTFKPKNILDHLDGNTYPNALMQPDLPLGVAREIDTDSLAVLRTWDGSLGAHTNALQAKEREPTPGGSFLPLDSNPSFKMSNVKIRPLCLAVSIFKYTDGYVAIPEGPGLGIEINEEAVRRAAAKGHDWRNPVWRNEDGSVVEW